MATIHGTCDEGFSGVRDVLSGNLDSGADVGASVAIVKDGELVVDIWGGEIEDLDGNTAPWAQDTLINVYSTTKTMCNLSALICADRGLIDLDAPVANYWPEFKANGKENVLVRHLLGHTAAVPGFTALMQKEDLYDWDKTCAVLANESPWWEPGTASGYHAITQGYLVGEVVRRVTGKSLGTFFREELAEPLGADFHIGTPPSCDPRVARLVPSPDPIIPAATDSASVAGRVFGNPIVSPAESWTEAWRRAEIPAANGHGNARSVARVQSVVSHGGEIDGKRYISAEGLERIFEVQMSGQPDLVLGVAITLGIGYGLISDAMPVAPTKRGCFWGGYGGSVVVNDLENRMTVAFVMNKMGGTTTGDARGIGCVWAAYAAINA
ncbi:MAG: beta-lactamase family protein [Actinobacteria bacterium]|nr:beta-lactamase family protein [Actinomycetota bacterium]